MSREHVAVSETIDYLVDYYNFERLKVPVDSEGIIQLNELDEILCSCNERVAMVSVMLANNEIGTVQPLREIKKIINKYDTNENIILHTDASQAVGKIRVDVQELQVDLLSLAGHKLYAPKGIGALYIRKTIEKKIDSLLHGASHERGLRAGTENVLLSSALGTAAAIFSNSANEEIIRLKTLRDLLKNTLFSKCQSNRIKVKINGPVDDIKRLPNTLSISITGFAFIFQVLKMLIQGGYLKILVSLLLAVLVQLAIVQTQTIHLFLKLLI